MAIEEGTLRSESHYDGYDRRVEILEKSSGAVISKKRFLWIGNSIVEERDSTGGTVARRFFSNGEQIGAERFYYTKDHLGSIRELTDSSGTVVARYDYDPYRKMEKISGSIDASFGFTGHYYHTVSGFNLTKYRAYNPDIGRWISRDPVSESGGLNLYGYVSNNPTNLVDPLGLDAALPKDPSGLPPEWKPDPTHKAPNGQRFRAPNGDFIDFHKPGKHQTEDHWHRNGEKKHLFPGDQIPDPLPVPQSPSDAPNVSLPKPDADAAAAAAPAAAAAAAAGAAIMIWVYRCGVLTLVMLGS